MSWNEAALAVSKDRRALGVRPGAVPRIIAMFSLPGVVGVGGAEGASRADRLVASNLGSKYKPPPPGAPTPVMAV